jgi:hypothetical protein
LLGIKPSVAFFRHLYSLRITAGSQIFGCVSFLSTPGTEKHFIDMKWVKKVDDFRVRCVIMDTSEKNKMFCVPAAPAVKLPSWSSEPLSSEGLNALRERIELLRDTGLTGLMVGKEFLLRRIAPSRSTRRTSRTSWTGTR